MSNCVVVDTNVWVKAHEGASSQKTPEEVLCAVTCVRWLTELRDSERQLAVDYQYKILGSYRKNLSGVSSVAVNILAHLQRTGRLLWVNIGLEPDGTAILPAELNLGTLDRDDRKFVAVALACEDRPPIVNATDGDWQQHIKALKAAGIIVEELCPDLVS